jgi:uncharacterized protein (DUF1697 family)
MARLVALLRGVNVGGNKVAMSELRALFERLGCHQVETYIQSGNVVFAPPAGGIDPDGLEAALASQFGFDVPVVLRRAGQLAGTLVANPYSGVEGTRLHVAFAAQPPSAEAVAALDPRPFDPDDCTVAGTEIYMHLPNGMGRSKLPAYLGRRLKVPFTVRNWNTVVKLAEMAAGD